MTDVETKHEALHRKPRVPDIMEKGNLDVRIRKQIAIDRMISSLNFPAAPS